MLYNETQEQDFDLIYDKKVDDTLINCRLIRVRTFRVTEYLNISTMEITKTRTLIWEKDIDIGPMNITLYTEEKE